LLMPLFLKNFGPSVAFGIPGLLMFVATLVFWLGRKRYVLVPPQRVVDPHAFSRVIRTALLAQAPGQGRAGLWLAWIGVALAAASFGLVPSMGFVIAFCVRSEERRVGTQGGAR